MHKKESTLDQVSGRRAQLFRRRRNDPLVDLLAAKYGTDQTAILPILQGIASREHTINAPLLGAIADATDVHDAHVAGVASFYSMLPSGDDAGVPIRICKGPACMLHGAAELEMAAKVAIQGDDSWSLRGVSCLGLCDRAPAVLVGSEPCGPVCDGRVGRMLHGWRGRAPDYRLPIAGERRIAMARLGQIDAGSYASARSSGAYAALEKAVSASPEQIVREIERSGLRGCGGAGFPTGKKWRMAATAPAEKKFVICNADESEPGAFKDRVLIEGDPHLVVEGIALAALAVGADEGIIYVRGEYEQGARSLERAIQQATEAGWLGKEIADSSFRLNLVVHRGAGAYICGEETALLESLEGRRGEPRIRPPYPTIHGLFGQPTVMNNVETLCMVPAIVRNGGDWFQACGTAGNRGTKLFAISGHARRSAAFEAPLGITVRSILNRFGLGMRTGSQFKMALTGGASGTLIPASLLDVPLDLESWREGVVLGSGVVIVFDTTVSAVTALEWLLRFFRNESCGKCTPCREGTVAAHDMVRRIADGNGQSGDVAELRRIASMLAAASFCGLGKSVELPIRSALTHFADDFEERGAS